MISAAFKKLNKAFSVQSTSPIINNFVGLGGYYNIVRGASSKVQTALLYAVDSDKFPTMEDVANMRNTGDTIANLRTMLDIGSNPLTANIQVQIDIVGNKHRLRIMDAVPLGFPEKSCVIVLANNSGAPNSSHPPLMAVLVTLDELKGAGVQFKDGKISSTFYFPYMEI